MFYSEYSGVVPDIQIMAKGIAGGLPLSAIVAKNYVMKGQKPGSMGGTYCEPFPGCVKSRIWLIFRGLVVISRKRLGLRRWDGRARDFRKGEHPRQRQCQVRAALRYSEGGTAVRVDWTHGPGCPRSRFDGRVSSKFPTKLTDCGNSCTSSVSSIRRYSVEFTPFTEPPSAASIISGAAVGANKSESQPGSVPQKGGQRVKDIGSRVAKKCLEKGMLILTTSVFDVIRFIPALNVTEEEMALACKIFKESVEEVAREG